MTQVDMIWERERERERERGGKRERKRERKRKRGRMEERTVYVSRGGNCVACNPLLILHHHLLNDL